jgi:hypothetical protein
MIKLYLGACQVREAGPRPTIGSALAAAIICNPSTALRRLYGLTGTRSQAGVVTRKGSVERQREGRELLVIAIWR